MGGVGDVNSLGLYVLAMILLGQGTNKRWLSATQMKWTYTTSHRPHRHGPLGLFSGDKQVFGCNQWAGKHGVGWGNQRLYLVLWRDTHHSAQHTANVLPTVSCRVNEDGGERKYWHLTGTHLQDRLQTLPSSPIFLSSETTLSE